MDLSVNYIELVIYALKTFSAISSALLGFIKALEALGKWRARARQKRTRALPNPALNYRMAPGEKKLPCGAMLALCALCYGMAIAMLPPFVGSAAMFFYASGAFWKYLVSAGVLMLALSGPCWMFLQAEKLRVRLRGYSVWPAQQAQDLDPRGLRKPK